MHSSEINSSEINGLEKESRSSNSVGDSLTWETTALIEERMGRWTAEDTKKER